MDTKKPFNFTIEEQNKHTTSFLFDPPIIFKDFGKNQVDYNVLDDEDPFNIFDSVNPFDFDQYPFDSENPFNFDQYPFDSPNEIGIDGLDFNSHEQPFLPNKKESIQDILFAKDEQKEEENQEKEEIPKFNQINSFEKISYSQALKEITQDQDEQDEQNKIEQIEENQIEQNEQNKENQIEENKIEQIEQIEENKIEQIEKPKRKRRAKRKKQQYEDLNPKRAKKFQLAMKQASKKTNIEGETVVLRRLKEIAKIFGTKFSYIERANKEISINGKLTTWNNLGLEKGDKIVITDSLIYNEGKIRFEKAKNPKPIEKYIENVRHSYLKAFKNHGFQKDNKYEQGKMIFMLL
ncbi:hypothetical protein M0811_04109 [Anaeramoeba ignava]|uniref:Uncharacterized protein n=1 Tax=Anaeramoeba ignava TaxID=1746090 RepID=A0A9Q0RG79_ANAIG|nr:hypothetical protein M0811_04109 [Anaeramoeba ignava]